jgi:hypothetical protein
MYSYFMKCSYRDLVERVWKRRSHPTLLVSPRPHRKKNVKYKAFKPTLKSCFTSPSSFGKLLYASEGIRFRFEFVQAEQWAAQRYFMRTCNLRWNRPLWDLISMSFGSQETLFKPYQRCSSDGYDEEFPQLHQFISLCLLFLLRVYSITKKFENSRGNGYMEP